MPTLNLSRISFTVMAISFALALMAFASDPSSGLSHELTGLSKAYKDLALASKNAPEDDQLFSKKVRLGKKLAEQVLADLREIPERDLRRKRTYLQEAPRTGLHFDKQLEVAADQVEAKLSIIEKAIRALKAAKTCSKKTKLLKRLDLYEPYFEEIGDIKRGVIAQRLASFKKLDVSERLIKLCRTKRSASVSHLTDYMKEQTLDELLKEIQWAEERGDLFKVFRLCDWASLVWPEKPWFAKKVSSGYASQAKRLTDLSLAYGRTSKSLQSAKQYFYAKLAKPFDLSNVSLSKRVNALEKQVMDTHSPTLVIRHVHASSTNFMERLENEFRSRSFRVFRADSDLGSQDLELFLDVDIKDLAMDFDSTNTFRVTTRAQGTQRIVNPKYRERSLTYRRLRKELDEMGSFGLGRISLEKQVKQAAQQVRNTPRYIDVPVETKDRILHTKLTYSPLMHVEYTLHDISEGHVVTNGVYLSREEIEGAKETPQVELLYHLMGHSKGNQEFEAEKNKVFTDFSLKHISTMVDQIERECIRHQLSQALSSFKLSSNGEGLDRLLSYVSLRKTGTPMALPYFISNSIQMKMTPAQYTQYDQMNLDQLIRHSILSALPDHMRADWKQALLSWEPLAVASHEVSDEESNQSYLKSLLGTTDPMPEENQEHDEPRKRIISKGIEALVRVKTAKGLGSGFFVSPEGYIVSNYHVVRNADKITILLKDDEEIPVEVVKVIVSKDLALLRTETESDDGFPFLELSEDPVLRSGDIVFALGAPVGLKETVTKGIISSVRELPSQFNS